MDEIILGTGFGCVTDIKVGPDGFVYVVSLSDGVIYRLVPKQYYDPTQVPQDPPNPQYLSYLPYVIPVIVAPLVLFYIERSRKSRVQSTI